MVNHHTRSSSVICFLRFGLNIKWVRVRVANTFLNGMTVPAVIGAGAGVRAGRGMGEGKLEGRHRYS